MAIAAKVRSLSLFAVLLLSISSVHGDRTLYVVANLNHPQPCDCPRSPPNENITCDTLGNYTSEEGSNNDNLTLIFLCGHHTLNTSNSTAKVSNVHRLSVVGNSSDRNQVVVRDIILEFQNVTELYLTNMTIMDVSFKVYPLGRSDHIPFHMSNCQFIGSDSVIIGADLTIQDSSIINGTNTAFNLASGSLTLAGNVDFDGNHGENGGALALTSTKLNIARNAVITFSRNSATGRGGAILVDNPTEILKVFPESDCFYRLLDYDQTASYNVSFTDNHAGIGGNHIFGASLKSCCTSANDEDNVNIPSYKIVSSGNVFHFTQPDFSNNTVESAITASPARVCICDDQGLPQCLDEDKIFYMMDEARYPGQLFNLSVVLVGADFGPTTGIVHASIRVNESLQGQENPSLGANQSGQILRSTKCTSVGYSIHSGQLGTHMLYLTAVQSNYIRLKQLAKGSQVMEYYHSIREAIGEYHDQEVIKEDLSFTPLFVHVSLKPCPAGFNLNHSVCSCYSMLTDQKGVECHLSQSGGYLSHPDLWIGRDNEQDSDLVILSRYCPLQVCNHSILGQGVNLENETSINAQCSFNHTGRFCGGCADNYSLAIGSSHCIICHNNNNLALLLFFALEGILLVLIVALLNLTVTHGMVNGLIFYANIIWVFKDSLFPDEPTTKPSSRLLLFLRIFIAWLNLDFGIETCFVVGLNAFWKTLLQYIFPLYIWSIVGLIILAARRSVRLTELLSSRAVSILSSLVLLSYMKLLRNAVESLHYTYLDYYNSTGEVHSLAVWAADGTLDYFGPEHSILFSIALFVIVVCMLFTFLLLFGQWLRTLHFFSRFHPIFDSYYAPIKYRHHYCLGLLVITRVFLYLLNFNLFPRAATFSLLITVTALFTYMTLVRPFVSTVNLVFYCTFLVNLIILSGSFLFVDTSLSGNVCRTGKEVVTSMSTGIAFVEFCVLVVVRSIKSLPINWCRNYIRRRKYQEIEDVPPTDHEELPTTSYASYRDSILEESCLSNVLESYD